MSAVLKLPNEFFSSVCALALAVATPCLHILAYCAPSFHKSHILDRKNCTCSCWDTVFKGPYERGIARYKHVYFNASSNNTKIWILTCLGIVAFFESVRSVFVLLIRRNFRISMGLLFLISLNSHCYAWWVHFNYWNDGFYHLENQQALFIVTKIICSALLFRGIDKRKALDTTNLLVIASISSFHIVFNGWDQFVHKVLLRNGKSFQVLRDMAVMSTDLLNLVVTIFEIRSTSKELDIWSVISERHNCLIIFIIVIMCLESLAMI